MYSSVTAALEGVSGQLHALADFTPGEDPVLIATATTTTTTTTTNNNNNNNNNCNVAFPRIPHSNLAPDHPVYRGILQYFQPNDKTRQDKARSPHILYRTYTHIKVTFSPCFSTTL